MRPSECKWCGCYEIMRDGFPTINGGREVLFGCGNVWQEDGNVWYRDPLWCGGQVGGLYRRLADALAVLKSVQRYDTDEVDPDTWCGDQVAQAVDADYVDEVIQILEGKSNDETE